MRKNQIIIVLLVLLNIIGLIIPYSVKNYKLSKNIILKNHRAKEADDICMPFKDIIRLIPEED